MEVYNKIYRTFFLSIFYFGWYDFHKEFIRKRNKLRMNWYIAEQIRIGFPFPKERKKYTSKMLKEEFFKEEANTLEWLYKSSNKLNHEQATQVILSYLDKLDYKQRYNATPEYLNHKAYKRGEDNYNNYFEQVLWKTLTHSLARAWLVLLAYILFFVFRNLVGF